MSTRDAIKALTGFTDEQIEDLGGLPEEPEYGLLTNEQLSETVRDYVYEEED